MFPQIPYHLNVLYLSANSNAVRFGICNDYNEACVDRKEGLGLDGFASSP